MTASQPESGPVADGQPETGLPGPGRYVRKPVEAIQVREGHGREVEDFLGDETWCEWIMRDPEQPGAGYRLGGLRIWVAKWDGAATLKPGDWIVRERDGGFLPLAADDFAAEYELAGHAATGSTDWCVAWGGEDANDCAGRLEYDDEAEAREHVPWITGSFVARRTVTKSRWETVPDGSSDKEAGPGEH